MPSRLQADVGLAKDLLRLLKPHTWVLPAVIVLGVLSSLAEGTGITLFIPFLSFMGSSEFPATTGGWLINGLKGIFANTPVEQRALVISATVLACIVLKGLFTFANSALSGWIDTTVCCRIRVNVFQQLLYADYRDFERSPEGRLYHALETQPWRTSEAVWQLLSLIVTGCTIVVFTAFLLLISWQLTIIAVLAASLISWVLHRLTRSASPTGHTHTAAEGILNERILEGLSGMKEIRIFGREAYEKGRFREAAEALRRVGWKLSAVRALSAPLYEVLAVALLLGVLLVSGMRDPGNLASILVYVFLLFRLQPSLASFERTRVHISSLEGDVRAVFSLMEEMRPPSPLGSSRAFSGLRHEIELRDIGYQYSPDAVPALKSVSVVIPAGKMTALVGPSGAGKTTLANLLLGLRHPTAGEIFADGARLDSFDIGSWRARISLVTQHPYIFSATIRENIAYGLEGASEEQIVQAARRANAQEFIAQLPRGFDTRIGSRGVLLSDGQRQRIALARALVREPDVLILDEATNAMDSISESAVKEALRQQKGKITIIVIAHRLSMVEDADNIIVLKGGELQEEGTPERLLESDGLFARLYKQQSGPSELLS